MLEILTLYVSSFWIWAGITVALSIVVSGIVKIIAIIALSLTGKDFTIN
jgi:hypothetical protein